MAQDPPSIYTTRRVIKRVYILLDQGCCFSKFKSMVGVYSLEPKSRYLFIALETVSKHGPQQPEVRKRLAFTIFLQFPLHVDSHISLHLPI